MLRFPNATEAGFPDYQTDWYFSFLPRCTDNKKPAFRLGLAKMHYFIAKSWRKLHQKPSKIKTWLGASSEDAHNGASIRRIYFRVKSANLFLASLSIDLWKYLVCVVVACLGR